MKTIPLTQGRFAIVDDEDFEWLSKYKWHFAVDKKTNSGGYAKTRNPHGKPAYLWMHKMILSASNQEEVDHKNGDSLNNLRTNLRKCTSHQNHYNSKVPTTNTSGFKGVSKPKHTRLWRARVKFNGKEHWAGYHDTRQSAAMAYDRLATKLFGEFAKTNHSLGLLPSI